MTMSGDDCARFVGAYLDHMGDASWAERGTRERGPGELLSASANLLRGGDIQQVVTAAAFVGDAATGALGDKVRRSVRPRIRERVRSALTACLWSNEYRARDAAVRCLGRMGFARDGATVERAFWWYLDRYPLELQPVMFELSYLGRVRGWARRIEAMVSHRRASVRWSTLDCIPRTHFRHYRWAELRVWRASLESLREDSSTDIAAESVWRLRLLEDGGGTAPPIDHGEAPVRTFEQVSSAFRRSLAERGLRDYSIDDFEVYAWGRAH